MRPIALGRGAYRRIDAQLPNVEVLNYYAEESPLAPEGVIWIPRPGLQLWRAGAGPLRGMLREPGSLDGDVVAVIGSTAVRIGSDGAGVPLGPVPDVDRVSMAGNLAGVMIATGSALLYVTSAGLAAVTVPFAQPVSVAYLAGYWVCVDGATQRRFYAPDTSPTTWAPLDFDSASEKPDPLKAVVALGGRLWDFGERTIEFRTPTGDADAPFAPEIGRSYQRGLLSRDTVVATDNTCVWVGDDRIVYRGGEVPQALSDAFLSERLSRAPVSEVYAWGFAWQGHVFYCLTVGDEGTFVLDLTSGLWSQWQSYGQSRWTPGLGTIGFDGLPLCGDVETGNIYRLNAERFSDDGEPIRGLLTGGSAMRGQRLTHASVRLEVVTGSIFVTGTDPEPLAVLEYSKDGGNSWTSAGPVGLGRAGEHNKRVIWRRLGQFSPPGPLFRFELSDPFPRRISGAYLDGQF
ncbi:MAG: hypothetical protein ACRC56_11890 [Bosea sp. (in: a-proteobacteria)]